MLKKFLAFLAALSVCTAFAAVDVNKGSEAELDGIKGIGPATSRQIIAERQKGEFKNWEDFMSRVKGIRAKKAAQFSEEGLTVGGVPYQGSAPVVKKTAAKADAPVAPASAASAAKK